MASTKTPKTLVDERVKALTKGGTQATLRRLVAAGIMTRDYKLTEKYKNREEVSRTQVEEEGPKRKRSETAQRKRPSSRASSSLG